MIADVMKSVKVANAKNKEYVKVRNFSSTQCTV